MEQKDYYQILGLEKDASEKQVRDAYRRLALRYHPDRNRDNPDAADRMKEINESYAVLSNPQKRREYDSLRQAYGSSAYDRFRQTYSDRDIFKDSDIQQIFEELSRAFGYRSFDDVFRESYGAGYRTFEFRRPGVFGRVIIGGFGNSRGLERNSPINGYLGRLIQYGLKKKWGIELPEKGRDLHDSIMLSPEITRPGTKIKYSNKKTGRELLVTIPPSIKEGQKLRLKGMGEAGHAGGETGDLYITIHVKSSLIQKAKDLIPKILSFINRLQTGFSNRQ
ncbi:MAG: DnaJ domain-containing protein [Smithella sp.]